MMLGGMTLTDLSPLANHLWQSTLCAIAVWLLTLALRKNHAAVRYWLWLAASVKVLVPFSLLVGMGSQVGWRTTMAPAIAQPQWSSVVEDIGRPFAASAPALRAVAPSALNPLPAILFAVWLCGLAVSIVLWFRCWRQIRAARKAATPLVLDLPIPVMSSPVLMEPGVFGVRKPVLLLPEGITDRLTPAQLRAVLAHEMCHVRRHDNLTAAIHMVVEAVFWFYPVVWWIRAHLVEEREQACDEAVLQSGSDAEVYAEGILNVCKFYVESPLACVSGISGSDLRKRIVRIMTERVTRKLDLSRKLLLSTAGLAAIAMPIVFGLLNATPSRAQSQAENTTASGPVYEVASIKPDKSGSGLTMAEFLPDGFTGTNISTKLLIEIAYNIEDYQLSGGPRWVSSEEYAVAAKVDESLVDELRKLSQNQRKLKNQPMLRALLADRFKLRFHHETQQLKAYALVIAKNGPKLQESKPGDTYPNGIKTAELPHGGANILYMGTMGQLTGQGVRVASLVQMLSGLLGVTVLDKTELTGNYDFTLKWTPDVTQSPTGSQQGTANAPLPDSSGPSLFAAIQEELGLKLESQKGPVEILVIDHIEKPSEN